MSQCLGFSEKFQSLNTFMDTSNKAKDILKEPTWDLDAIDNEFRGEIQRKPRKVTSMKQKLKSVSTGLH